MRLFSVSALLAIAPLAAPAVAAPLQHFSRDGVSYSYIAARNADGIVTLNGTVDSTGDAFRLRVRSTQVDGNLGLSRVSFAVSPETAARLVAEVPGNGAMPTTLAAN